MTFAIRSIGAAPDQATASRNLPFEAGMAVAFGLPEAEALKAVTLTPAQILGVADQLGSLEVGKRANLVITAGHILQPTTEVKGLFIGGKPAAPREPPHPALRQVPAPPRTRSRPASPPSASTRPVSSTPPPRPPVPPPAARPSGSDSL